ncbi:MAG: hypothetical protein KJ714_07780, partial [Euryarchaeota archaeon]|nr:hypothetical protein [Euryarchaeota archaeon]
IDFLLDGFKKNFAASGSVDRQLVTILGEGTIGETYIDPVTGDKYAISRYEYGMGKGYDIVELVVENYKASKGDVVTKHLGFDVETMRDGGKLTPAMAQFFSLADSALGAFTAARDTDHITSEQAMTFLDFLVAPSKAYEAMTASGKSYILSHLAMLAGIIAGYDRGLLFFIDKEKLTYQFNDAAKYMYDILGLKLAVVESMEALENDTEGELEKEMAEADIVASVFALPGFGVTKRKFSKQMERVFDMLTGKDIADKGTDKGVLALFDEFHTVAFLHYIIGMDAGKVKQPEGLFEEGKLILPFMQQNANLLLALSYAITEMKIDPATIKTQEDRAQIEEKALEAVGGLQELKKWAKRNNAVTCFSGTDTVSWVDLKPFTMTNKESGGVNFNNLLLEIYAQWRNAQGQGVKDLTLAKLRERSTDYKDVKAILKQLANFAAKQSVWVTIAPYMNELGELKSVPKRYGELQVNLTDSLWSVALMNHMGGILKSGMEGLTHEEYEKSFSNVKINTRSMFGSMAQYVMKVKGNGGKVVSLSATQSPAWAKQEALGLMVEKTSTIASGIKFFGKGDHGVGKEGYLGRLLRVHLNINQAVSNAIFSRATQTEKGWIVTGGTDGNLASIANESLAVNGAVYTWIDGWGKTGDERITNMILAQGETSGVDHNHLFELTKGQLEAELKRRGKTEKVEFIHHARHHDQEWELYVWDGNSLAKQEFTPEQYEEFKDTINDRFDSQAGEAGSKPKSFVLLDPGDIFGMSLNTREDTHFSFLMNTEMALYEFVQMLGRMGRIASVVNPYMVYVLGVEAGEITPEALAETLIRNEGNLDKRNRYHTFNEAAQILVQSYTRRLQENLPTDSLAYKRIEEMILIMGDYMGEDFDLSVGGASLAIDKLIQGFEKYKETMLGLIWEGSTHTADKGHSDFYKEISKTSKRNKEILDGLATELAALDVSEKFRFQDLMSLGTEEMGDLMERYDARSQEQLKEKLRTVYLAGSLTGLIEMITLGYEQTELPERAPHASPAAYNQAEWMTKAKASALAKQAGITEGMDKEVAASKLGEILGGGRVADDAMDFMEIRQMIKDDHTLSDRGRIFILLLTQLKDLSKENMETLANAVGVNLGLETGENILGLAETLVNIRAVDLNKDPGIDSLIGSAQAGPMLVEVNDHTLLTLIHDGERTIFDLGD